MNVLLTAAAEQDLEAIADFIARDTPVRVLSFVRELRTRCMGLTDYPSRFPFVPRYEQQGVRHCVHGNYLILYRIAADDVIVLRIVHGAMDYSALLFPA